MKRAMSSICLVCITLVSMTATSSGAYAQDGKMGDTDFAVGLRNTTGYLYDPSPTTTNDGLRADNYSIFTGLAVQASMVQLFMPEVSMGADATLGFLYLNENTLSHKGYASESTNFEMAVELIVRYHPFGDGVVYPFGDGNGPYIGAGIGGQWIFLEDGTFTAFVLGARLGWSIGIGDYRLMLELGNQYPLIKGLSGEDYTVQRDDKDQEDKFPGDVSMQEFFFSVIFTF